MARQETLNAGHAGSVNGVLHGIGDLGGNVVTLTTLQAQLAAEDLRVSINYARPALIAVAILVPLAFASVTVGLFGLAYWVSVDLVIPLARTLLGVAVGGLILTGIIGYLAMKRLSMSTASFRRSQEEFKRNVEWLRTVMLNGGR